MLHNVRVHVKLGLMEPRLSHAKVGHRDSKEGGREEGDSFFTPNHGDNERRASTRRLRRRRGKRLDMNEGRKMP